MDDLRRYDYHLPEGYIADRPASRREESRLLLVDRRTGRFAHHSFGDLPDLLAPRDLLVLNDTRVLPARLFGRRRKTGGKWEGLFVGEQAGGVWRVMGQTRGRLHLGEELEIRPAHPSQDHADPPLILTLIERHDGGVWAARVNRLSADGLETTSVWPPTSPTLALLEEFGTVPLPPYLHRKLAAEADWKRYQTTYASQPGAIAAPTAGLHFTPELLHQCGARGIAHTFVTLHVGVGTFRPISVEDLNQHEMHAEWCELPAATARNIQDTRDEGGRVVAVGTTSVRTLESAAVQGALCGWQGETRLFIRPPYEFQAVDALITNFHLPKSTLFVLVCAFAGIDLMHAAYAAAIAEHYRFYSYGDAMLIV